MMYYVVFGHTFLQHSFNATNELTIPGLEKTNYIFAFLLSC